MNMSVRLNNLAAVSTGTARAVFESANAAYRAIFENEENELAELSELGNELGDDLGTEAETEDPNATQEPAEQTEQPSPEQPAPEQSGPAPEPQNVNAQSQPASISADALIKELKDLKYDEKIRIVAQKMKRAAKGKAPDAEDMAKPVAEAIAKYMTKKGYAAMDKEDFEKALEYSRIVKYNPDNVHYAFFGRYSEAFCMMQLAKRNSMFTMEEAERRYQEEIAFFRNEMLKTNENAAYALVFRTRMYAEIGKFTKAEELADLMADSDKAEMMDYIAQCRKEQE